MPDPPPASALAETSFSFYPPHLRRLFTDRARELNILRDATDQLAAGRPKHLALFGLRRIGKTLLLLEHAVHMVIDARQDVRPVYLDLEELATSPEFFSRRYVGLVTYWALTGAQADRETFLTPMGLLSGPAAGLRTVAQTVAALDAARDDPAAQMSLAFDFPEKLAAELDIRLLLLLDEFTELAVLANYPAVRRPLHLFRAAMQRHGRIGYVIAASAVTAMQGLIQDGSSPLFLQFQLLEIPPFPLDATAQLTERILGYTPPPGVVRQLQSLTGGHPFYIHATLSRLNSLVAPEVLSPDAIAQAFLSATLSRNGLIYNYCRYLHDISLSRARGYGILKAILQTLAIDEGLALTEIARRIQKGPAPTRTYLRALQEVNLVLEQDGEYFYRDRVLRYWVAALIRGIEIDIDAPRSSLTPLLAELEAQQAPLSTELGRAQESRIRELLRSFSGQSIDGALFELEGFLVLPFFSPPGAVTAYRSPDGQTELDTLAVAADGLRWAVEIKWRSKAAGDKELVALSAKAQAVDPRAWCISRSGFTSAAHAYAAAHGVLLSTRSDLDQITRILGQY